MAAVRQTRGAGGDLPGARRDRPGARGGRPGARRDRPGAGGDLWFVVCFFVVLAALAIFVFGPLENDGPQGRFDGPVLVGAPIDDHMLADVSGAVTYDGRCLRLDGASILWPPGTRWDGRGVVLDDGTLVVPGDRIEGGGGWLQSVHNLAGDEVGALARACSDADGQIAVLHTVARLAPA